MATLGLDTSEYEQKIETAKKETQSAANSLNRSANTAGNGVSGMASQFAAASAKATVLANMLTSLGTKAVGLAKGFVEMGISYNAQIEKYTTGFTNMLGSAQAAQEAMQAIQEDAARTPFDVASLTQANQLLISAGENAEYSRKVINALGDAVSATGGGNDELSRMAANLQQIANVGKASAIDIKQFAYAGINIYQILADYTGKSVQEVQNMTISYDLLSQALIAASEEGGRYYNAMDTQSQTMDGRISTLKDNVSQLSGLMTGDLSSGIGVVIGHLNDMAVAAQEAYKEDGWKGLGNAILELDNPISAIIKKFGELGNASVSALDKASYWLNKALGKNAYAGYDSYEDYKSDQQKQSNRNRLRQNALSGKSVSNKSWSERQSEAAAASGGSSIVTGPSGSSGKSTGTKSKTETVIATVSHTSTSTAQNELGTVVRSIETLDEKVKDASGNIKDRVTETTTETGKEMVNGVETTYKLVTKKVDGVVEKTTKTYDDMSKTLLGTLTTTAKKVFDGITTTTQKTTETYADGSQHVKETVTETGERIVYGAAQTYTKVINYVDGVKDKVTETAEIIDQSVKGVQSRIEQYASEISNQTSKGIIGRLKTAFSQLSDGDFAGLSLTFVKLLFGQVDQKQREAMLKWFSQALDVINEGYNGGGLGKAFDIFQKIFNGEGVKADIDGVTTSVKGLSAVLGELAKAGGAGGILANIGTGIAGVGEKIMGVLGNVVAFVAENPIVLAIAAVVAGAAALGIALWKKYGKSSSDNKSSTGKIGYKDIQDAYWYGNERAFAGYDYRTDPYTFRSTNGEIQSYQSRIQEAVSGLYDVVKEYLPKTANQQIVLEDGTLVGAIAPGMDAQLGQLAALAERGN